VWSLKRGVIDPPEELDEAGQAAAFWQLRHDESQALRVNFELCRNRVVWNIGEAARIEAALAKRTKAKVA